MFEKRMLTVFSVIIGALFVISGIGKVIDTEGFSILINQYGLGYLMILSPLIVLFEILLGLLLILLIHLKRYSMISFVLLFIFTISFTYAHFKYGINDCGCFGTIQPSNMPFISSFIRNIILLAMTLILWIKYPKEKMEIASWKKYLIVSVMSISIFTAGYTFRMPYFLTVKKEIHKFQNQIVKNTELADYIKTSPDSSYLVFCFSYTCPYCLNSIENLRQYQKSNTVDRIVVFAIGEPKDKLIFEQMFKPDFAVRDLSLQAMDKLTIAYPTAFYIEHDTVKVIIQSELPSPYVLKKMYNLHNVK